MKKRISNAIAILVCVFLLITACQPKPTAAPTASPLTGALSELRGVVNSKQADEADFHAVAAGDILRVNGQVQTGEDGHARLDLSTGTIIRVVPVSLFTLVSNEPAGGGLMTKLKLELGRVFVILQGGSLDVETPSGVASVSGSFMMVEIVPATLNVLVTCLEGDCRAGNPGGSLDFTDGQKTTLFPPDPSTGQYQPPQLEDMNEEDFQKWRDENPEAQDTLEQVLAGLPKPTEPPVPSPEPSKAPDTQSGQPGQLPCFKLISPLASTQLNLVGPVNFSWEPQAGAAKYQVTFTYPNGTKTTFETTSTDMTRYMETMPGGGQYSWQVTALDANNAPICSAEASTFTKLDTANDLLPPPTEEEKKFTCTYDTAQWSDSTKPCYCDPNSYSNPSYCYGGGY